MKELELGSKISILEPSGLVAQWLKCWTSHFIVLVKELELGSKISILEPSGLVAQWLVWINHYKTFPTHQAIFLHHWARVAGESREGDWDDVNGGESTWFRIAPRHRRKTFVGKHDLVRIRTNIGSYDRKAIELNIYDWTDNLRVSVLGQCYCLPAVVIYLNGPVRRSSSERWTVGVRSGDKLLPLAVSWTSPLGPNWLWTNVTRFSVKIFIHLRCSCPKLTCSKPESNQMNISCTVHSLKHKKN